MKVHFKDRLLIHFNDPFRKKKLRKIILKNIQILRLGATPREYCVQTNLHSSNDYSENRFEKCDICDMKNKPHPADHMIDFKNEAGLTWWQSDTIEYDIQYPNSVNITIHLGNFS